MEIILHGNPDDLVEYRGSCRNCNCQVLFRYKEGALVRDKVNGHYLRINCPTCMTWICVDL